MFMPSCRFGSAILEAEGSLPKRILEFEGLAGSQVGDRPMTENRAEKNSKPVRSQMGTIALGHHRMLHRIVRSTWREEEDETREGEQAKRQPGPRWCLRDRAFPKAPQLATETSFQPHIHDFLVLNDELLIV